MDRSSLDQALYQKIRRTAASGEYAAIMNKETIDQATLVILQARQHWGNSAWNYACNVLAALHQVYELVTHSEVDRELHFLFRAAANLPHSMLNEPSTESSNSQSETAPEQVLYATARSLAVRLKELSESAGGLPHALVCAITILRALGSSPISNTEDPTDLENILAAALLSMYEVTQAREYVDESIQVFRKILAQGSLLDPGYPSYLGNLGTALIARNESPDDLREAVKLLKECVSLTPPDNPKMAIRLNNLGTALFEQSQRPFSESGIQEAIATLRRAAFLVPKNPSGFLNARYSLAKALYIRALNSDSLDYFQEPCHVLETITKSASHDSMIFRLASRMLGSILLDLYKKSGNAADLVRAIAALQPAVEDLKVSPEHRKTTVQLFATALSLRYGGFQELDDNIPPIPRHYLAIVAATSDEDRHQLRYSLAELLWDASKTSGNEPDLREAIFAIERAVVTSTDEDVLVYYASNLADAYRAAFEGFGDPADLRAAIEQAKVLIGIKNLPSPQRSKVLLLLGSALYTSCLLTGSPQVTEQAVGALREGLNHLLDPYFAAQAKMMLGKLLSQQSQTRDEGLHLLRDAIAITFTPEMRAPIASMLIDALHQAWLEDHSRQHLDELLTLVHELTAPAAEKGQIQIVFMGLRHAHTHQDADLQELLEAAEYLVNQLDSEISTMSEIAEIVTRAVSRHSEREPADRTLIEAGATLLAAVNSILPLENSSRLLSSLALYFDIGYYIGPTAARGIANSPTLAKLLNIPSHVSEEEGREGPLIDDLFSALSDLYDQTLDEALLDWIRKYLRSQLNILHDEEIDHRYIDHITLRYCAFLANAYEKVNHIPLLDEALELSRSMGRSGPKSLLRATLFSHRFDAGREQSLLREGISELEQALEDCDNLDQEMQSLLWRDLGSLLRKEYEAFGIVSSLHQAVQAGSRSIDLAPNEQFRTACESDLSGALRMAARESGDLSAFYEALGMSKAVLRKTDTHDPRLLVRKLRTSLFLQVLWQWTGDIPALEESIALLRSIVPGEGTGRVPPLALVALGQGLLVRSDSADEIWREGIKYLERAINESPAGSAVRIMAYARLGEALLASSARTSQSREVERAIDILEKAKAEQSTEGDPMILQVLADAYEAQYANDQNLESLRRAKEYTLQALNSPRLSQESEGFIRSGLGDLLAKEQVHIDGDDLMTAAEAQYKIVALNQGAPATLRLHCARNWLESARPRQPWSEEVATIFEAAISSLSRLMTRSVSHIGEGLSRNSSANLIAEAAESALAAGDGVKALDWLEQGRGLLMSALWGENVLAMLANEDEELATELRQLAEQLDWAPLRRIGIGENTNSTQDSDPNGRSILLGRWDTALRRARSISGFENLLSTFDVSALRRHLSGGTLVYVVIGSGGGYALLIGQQRDPVIVHLPNANVSLALAWTAGIASASRFGRSKDHRHFTEENDKLSQILSEIWHATVRPILDLIRMETGKPSSLLRIHWCPVGIASFLPLHAAGSRIGNSAESALDWAISSYTPTAQALLRNVQQDRPYPGRAENHLGDFRSIAIPYAPGQPDIAYALQEAEKMKEAFNAKLLIGGEATRENVWEFLDRGDSVHFAGHALNDPTEPVRSQLLAYDGAITVRDITRLERRPRGLAYLSACGTASASSSYADESIHLAGSFLLAGFSNVIATLWPVGDRAAAFAADEVIQGIRSEGIGATPQACRSAALKLREEFPQFPVMWAPYVHFGGG
jgi:tetratricopeptide (TPR) repeat protein